MRVVELTDVDLRRARGWAQLLRARPARRAVDDVVAAIVGMQAQDLRAAALSIRPRSVGIEYRDVAAALADGSIALTWTLRGTRHLHRADDVRWLVALLGPAFNRPNGARARQLGIEGARGDDAVATLCEALHREGPLTRARVQERLVPVGIDPEGQAPVHVIRRAALEGRLCVVPAVG